jgi:hypothetical protein
MIKKTISLLLMFFIAIGSMLTVNAQDNSSYDMWESLMLTPDNTKIKALGEAMSKHNKKYHANGPYKATVYNISSGPNAGKLIWEMGPLKFSDLDGRPSAGGHDEDWRDNVMPNIKRMNTIEYWKEMDEVSNTGMLDDNNVTHPLLIVRYHEISKGNGSNISRLLKQISETVKAMDGENPWGVYSNELRQGFTIGRHIATVGFMKNWAELDKDDKFKETFIKVHGDNSWDAFIDGMDHTFANSWDEIWEYNATLSGK